MINILFFNFIIFTFIIYTHHIFILVIFLFFTFHLDMCECYFNLISDCFYILMLTIQINLKYW